MHPMPVVLVLASGRGERFRASGGVGSKLQADLCGRTVIERTLDAVRASGLQWHLEDVGHDGMGDSIAAAVQATRAAAGWLVLPGDLPLVQPESLRAVAAGLRHGAVVVPVHQGVRGHPVGFSAACGESLVQLAGAGGAAAVVKSYASRGEVLELPVADSGVVTDIDTLADLDRARQLLRAAREPGSGSP